MLKAHARRLQRLTIAADIGVAAAVCVAALNHPTYGARSGEGFSVALLALVATASLVWPVALTRLGLYGSIRRMGRWDLLSRLVVAMSSWMSGYSARN